MKLLKRLSIITICIAFFSITCFSGMKANAAFSDITDINALYVSASATYPAAIPPTNCFTNVIDAINYNENNGGGKTIYVDDGIYTGSFYIRKPVSIIGTSKNAIIQCTENVLQPGADGLGAPTCLWVQSSDVTIENITIQGCAPTRAYGVQCCVYVTASNSDGSYPVSNVHIINNFLEPDYWANASQDAGYAIDTQSYSSVHITDLTISGNTIQPLRPTLGASRPFVINPGCENTTIENNEIKGKYVTGSIFSGQAGGNVVVNNNKFDGTSTYSVCVWPGGHDGWGDVAITNNEFSNWLKYPIYIYETQISSITGNTFTDIIKGTSPDNVAVRQYIGETGSTITPNEMPNTCLTNMPYIYAQTAYSTGTSNYVDYIPQTYTVEYYKDTTEAANKIGDAVSGVSYISSIPITETIVTADLGANWLDSRKPDGYNSGSATYPTPSTVIGDNVVKVLYEKTPIPSVTYTATQIGGTDTSADTTGIRLDFSQPIVLTAADVDVTNATVDDVTKIAPDGASWFIAMTLNSGLANGDSVTVTIKNSDNFTVATDSTKNVVIYKNVPARTVLTSVDHANDVTTDHWFYDSVKYAIDNKLFHGMSSNHFAPEENMTRAMMLTVLARHAGIDTTTGTTWYSAAVNWGIANGITDGTNMDANVTREELVTLLWRYAGSPAANYTLTFADDPVISDYALDAMKWAVATGIITGYPDNTIRPQGLATRAEGTAIIHRFSLLPR